jgi:hypothetical protein
MKMDTYNKAMSESPITDPSSMDGSLINLKPDFTGTVQNFRGPNFIVESINNKALEIWDKTYDEVIGKPFLNCLLKQKMVYYKYSIKYTLPNLLHEYMVLKEGKLDTAYFNYINLYEI